MLFKPTPGQLELLNKAAAAKDVGAMSAMLTMAIMLDEMPSAFYIIHHHFDCLSPEAQVCIEKAGMRARAAEACKVAELLAEMDAMIDKAFADADRNSNSDKVAGDNVFPSPTTATVQ